MLDKNDIRCLLFERGGEINFINEERGNSIIQAVLVKTTCSHETSCPFLNKYQRCPTPEEIQLKYLQANN